jgi:TrmH family RNA methyltransferase
VVPVPQLRLPAQIALVLALDQVRDPGNAGSLLRTAEAAGVDVVCFMTGTVDPFNGKVIRSGMGVHFRMPIRVISDWTELTAMLPRDAALYLADVSAPTSYDEVDWKRPAALVVGGEAKGAGHDARSLAQLISIPMCGSAESLNASVAGAIILFEAQRQRRAGR